MRTQEFDSDSFAELITAELVRIRPHLGAAELSPDASLTQDLGLDSLDLEQLFAFIKSNVADLDLTPWFLSAARRGSDSLASLARFVAAASAQPRAA